MCVKFFFSNGKQIREPSLLLYTYIQICENYKVTKLTKKLKIRENSLLECLKLILTLLVSLWTPRSYFNPKDLRTSSLL